MINTPVFSTLTIVPLHAATLDNRARQWVRDLELKGRNRSYLRHPDFEPAYHAGFAFYHSEAATGYKPTLASVIDNIEQALSHAAHHKLQRFDTACNLGPISYASQVGFLFGWLTVLLQTDAAHNFPFLLAPVADMHSYRAARCVPVALPRSCGTDSFPLDM